MVDNNKILMTTKEKQCRLFKVYTVMIIIVTLISTLNTATDLVSGGKDISEAASNMKFYNEIAENFNGENIYNGVITGVNIISVIIKLFKFITDLLHSVITFVIISISTLVTMGNESKTKNTICKILNILAIAEIIAYFLFVLNFDFGDIEEFLSISTVIFIIKLVSKLYRLLILVTEAVLIIVFTFCRLKKNTYNVEVKHEK